MERILITMLCSVCLWCACTKEEVPSIYTGPDGVNFYYDQAGPYDSDPYPNSNKQGSLNSSKLRDTLWFKILVLGNPCNKDRKFTLKQSALSALDSVGYYTGHTPQVKVAEAGVNYVPFDDPEIEKYCVIPAGAADVMVPVIMIYNPAIAGKSETFRIHFEFVETDELVILDPRFYRATCKFTQYFW